jgi:hypothetical protein
VKVDKIAEGVAKFINKSERAQAILRGVSKNPAMAGAMSSFILSTTVRPATVLAITPDKDDAKYGACSSISAAITEVVGSYLIFKPMNKMIEESSKQLYKQEGSIFYHNPLLLRRYKSLTNRFAKLPPTLLIALLRFSMIYPITQLLGKFGIVKKSERGQEEKKGLDVKA